MRDQPLRHDPRHHQVGVVDPLPTVEPEREREGVGDVVWAGWG
jgi:hypothetical protein